MFGQPHYDLVMRYLLDYASLPDKNMSYHLQPAQAKVVLLAHNANMRDIWHIMLMHQHPHLEIYHASCNDRGEAWVLEIQPDVLIIESKWPLFAGLQSLYRLRPKLPLNTLLLGLSLDQPICKEDQAFDHICHKVFRHPAQISQFYRYIQQHVAAPN